MQHRLGRGDDDDGVGVEQRRVDAPPLADLDECGVLGVVDDGGAVEASGEIGRDDVAELVRAWAPLQAARDEQRHLLVGDAEACQLGERGREGALARVARGGGERQGRRLDDDGDAGAGAQHALERLAGKRVAERVAHGCRDVGDALGGRAGAQHDGSRRRIRDDQAGAAEQGNAGHGASLARPRGGSVRIGVARCRPTSMRAAQRGPLRGRLGECPLVAAGDGTLAEPTGKRVPRRSPA